MTDWVDREPLPAQLWDRLRERSVLVVGPRRTGKSRLLEQMAQSPPLGIWMVVVDLQGLDRVEGMVERTQKQLSTRTGRWAALASRVESAELAGLSLTLSRAPEGEAWSKLEELLQESSPDEGGLLVVALDEVPWWLDALEQKVPGTARTALAQLRYLRGRLPRVRWVLTGSVGLAGPAIDWGAAAELNDLDLVEVGPMTAAQGHTLFEMVCLSANRPSDPAAAARAHQLAGGLPHWIRVLAERARSSAPPSVGPEQVEAEVERLLARSNRHLFDEEGRVHFERRYPEDERRLALTVLRSVAQAERVPRRGVLAETLASGLLGSEGARERFERVVDRLLDEFYLVEEGDELRFLVPLMARWMRRWG
jgi:hypothetical protein